MIGLPRCAEDGDPAAAALDEGAGPSTAVDGTAPAAGSSSPPPTGPAGSAAGQPDPDPDPDPAEPEPESRKDYDAPAELDHDLPGGVSVGDVVRAWAPVWYHDVAFRGPDGLGPKMDWYMAVDFDSDLRHDDNWEAMVDHEVRAAIYYAFVATQTHWFITFSQYHARDWEQICSGMLTECHEGDMEHVRLVLIAGAGDDGLGTPLLALSDAHGALHTWSTPPGPEEFGPIVDWETADGQWREEAGPDGRRLRLFTESKGHGPIPCRARESAPFGGWWGFGPGKPACEGAPYEGEFPGGDGVVFRPDQFAAGLYEQGAVEAGLAVDYALLDYVSELWPHRRALGHGQLLDPDETMSWVGGRGDPAFAFDLPIGVKFDAQQFPVEGYGRLGWSETLEGSAAGDLFFDPAHALKAKFPALADRPEGWSMQYTYNPYVGS